MDNVQNSIHIYCNVPLSEMCSLGTVFYSTYIIVTSLNIY
jgi:hypothetical protein